VSFVTLFFASRFATFVVKGGLCVDRHRDEAASPIHHETHETGALIHECVAALVGPAPKPSRHVEGMSTHLEERRQLLVLTILIL
jgi:hypothetical protein